MEDTIRDMMMVRAMSNSPSDVARFNASRNSLEPPVTDDGASDDVSFRTLVSYISLSNRGKFNIFLMAISIEESHTLTWEIEADFVLSAWRFVLMQKSLKFALEIDEVKFE